MSRVRPRRRVAAAVATAATCTPTASRARWASRAVAPVVSTSSQTTTCATGYAAASRRSRAVPHAHRALEVGEPGCRRPARTGRRPPRARRAAGRPPRATSAAPKHPRRRPHEHRRRVLAAFADRRRPRRDGDQDHGAGEVRHRRRHARGQQHGQWLAQRAQTSLLVAEDERTRRARRTPRQPRAPPGRPVSGPASAAPAEGRGRCGSRRTAPAPGGRSRRRTSRAAGRPRRRGAGDGWSSRPDAARPPPGWQRPALRPCGGEPCGGRRSAGVGECRSLMSVSLSLRSARETSVKLPGVAARSGVPGSGEPTSHR